MTLQNISVFHEYGAYRENGVNAPMYCSAWGSFELENGSIPLDKTVKNGSKKVYRVKAAGSGGIMFPLHGWGAFSLEQYLENGYIEFDALGASGGEYFSIGLRSDTRGVVKTHSVSLASQDIKITNAWQRIKIPIKTIAGKTDDGFSIDNITMVVLDNPRAQTFYLSEMYITSPDSEKQHPVIKVNQAGYRLNHAKYALVSCFPGIVSLSEQTEFSVINKNGDARFTGTLQAVAKSVDATSGELVFKADFSSLNEPGEYHISITNPKIDNSFSFTIGDSVYDILFVDAMKYFYFQRQGIDLEEQYAGIFARKNMHPGDSRVKKLSERANANAPTYDISQGWYDAGDFGKYMPPAASTVSDLLFAYELFPRLFSDRQLNIPESGNGVPDFLDEIKWELDMMLKMEDGATGGFYEVANYTDVNGVETIFIIDTNGSGGAGNTKSTAATASAGAVFAHAYIVYKSIPRYAAFADKCLAAAKRIWDYLEANPGNVWVNGAGRSYEHSQSETAMIKFWAAAALYRATGTAKYQEYVLKNYRGFDYNRQFNPYQVVTIGSLGTGFIHYAMSQNPDAACIKFFEEKFSTFQAGQLNNYREKAWPTALVDWAYFWGSSAPICKIPVELYMCNRALKKDTAMSVQMLRDSIHYLLGINPLSFSFVSGYGENCVKNIYSGIYSYDGIDEIPRGYLAGGANQYEAGFMSNYVSKSYVDSDREWTTNEHAIYWNAALVLSLAVEMGTAEMKN
ncbi:MAG: glycoside hydrolase family 9 protein [Treponema sp.]|nr:glycoside hydrolase family 9 protein [Treponema sp.]